MSIKQTIRKVLNENVAAKFMKMIDEVGLVKASQYIGFYELKKHLGNSPEFQEKIIDAISDYAKEHDNWLSLNDAEESFLYQKLSDGVDEQIEYLTDEGVVVVCYKFISDSAGWDHLEEYDIPYVMLSESTLEHILKLIIDNKI